MHSFYSAANPSGENLVVAEQARALLEAGHDVTIVARHTDQESDRLLYPFASALRVATGRGSSPADELRAIRPDVVHVHNLFPNFGTRWLVDWPGPIVATLHNYRYVCARATLLREGRWCTECPRTGSLAAVRHRCYRDSAAATLPLAVATRRGLAHHPLMGRADRLIVLSPTAEGLFTAFGGPADRLRLVPNFTRALHEEATAPPADERYLAVGRLSAEKGFGPLIETWPSHRPLDIIGRAAGDSAVRLPQRDGVRMLGAVDNTAWRLDLDRYTAVIVPGMGPEGAVPQVAIEAWEGGVPVIAPRASGLGRYLEDIGGGVTVDDDTSLDAALDTVVAGGMHLRTVARRVFEKAFTEPAWQHAMTEVYQEAVASR